MKKLLLLSAVLWSSSSYADLESRVSELETNALINPLRFGSEVVTRYDSIERDRCVDGTSPQGFPVPCETIESEKISVHRLKFRLNFEAKTSPKLSFYGRLSASKLMARLTGITAEDEAVGKTGEEQGGRNYSGSEMYLERAFFNYRLLDDLIFSAGRLPTVDGGPKHLTEGAPPMGTYPMLAYDAVLDGYALTYGLGDFTFRGVYHPVSNLHRSDSSGGLAKQKLFLANMPDKNEIYVGMIDYTNRKIGFARKLNVIFHYLTFEDFVFADAGVPNTYSDLSMGYDSLVAYFELTNIARLGLNLGLTFHQTTMHSKGSFMNPSALVDSLRQQGVPESEIKARVEESLAQTPAVGVMTDKRDDSTSGMGTQMVVSYRLPVKALKKPTVGLEYFSADKTYTFFNLFADDVAFMHSVRGGSSMHLFWSQPLDPNLKLRLGYITKEQKYQEGLIIGSKPKTISELRAGQSKTTLKDTSSVYFELNMVI